MVYTARLGPQNYSLSLLFSVLRRKDSCRSVFVVSAFSFRKVASKGEEVQIENIKQK